MSPLDRHTVPDFRSAALITIDTQVDTLDGQPFEVPGTTALLPNMSRLVEGCRREGIPVVHIVRLYERDGSNAELCRRGAIERGNVPFCPDTPGSQLAAELLPGTEVVLDSRLLLARGIQEIGPGEVAIFKPRWGAFYQTPLQDHLQGLGVTTLVFTGCNYPNCPRASIYQASERDYRIVLVEDAISNLDDRGREEMMAIGVVVMTTEEVEGALAPRQDGLPFLM